MRGGVAGALFYFVLMAIAAAQVRSIEAYSPRPFGYFVGDIIQRTVDVTVDPAFHLEDGSLPKIGPVTYWLELREVKLGQSSFARGRRYRLDLTYQLFYVALDPRRLEIPQFSLTFMNGQQMATATIDAWSFGVSPLREVEPPPVADPAEYLRPDAPAHQIDLRPLGAWTAAFALATFLTALALTYDRAWPPFRKRPGRPFSAAAQLVRRILRKDGEGAYLPALLILHRAVDAAAGQRVLADDVPVFLDRHPQFKSLAADFNLFFQSSRQAFFRANPTEAAKNFPPEMLVAFGDGLAAAERRAA